MAENSENPHPERIPIDGSVVEGSDLNSDRKKTLRDYIRTKTDGSNPEYGNRTTNSFPIADGQTEINNGVNDDGVPTPLTVTEDAQAAFTKTVEDGAKQIFDEISSGAFFEKLNIGGQEETRDTGPIVAIAEDADLDPTTLKNNQTFGHGAGTSERYKSVSEQVSNVLINNNRWATSLDSSAGVFSNNSIGTSPRIGRRRDGQYFQPLSDSDNATPNNEKYQKLGAEAVLAGSGYTAPEGGGEPKSGDKGGANWSRIFDDFKLENIKSVYTAATSGVDTTIAGTGGLGARHTGDTDILRSGTARVSSRSTNPGPGWLNNEVTVPINYINHAGESSTEQGTEEHFAYTVMNNMIDKFIEEELFTSEQYTRSLAFMAAIFIDNILTAALFDVLLLAEFLTLNPQGRNLRDQYDQKDGTKLAQGKARGNIVPVDQLKESAGFNITADLFELLGLPNPVDLFSGAALVEFVLKFMGVNKPIQSKTNLIIGGLQIGDFISFVPSYTVGSLQTTISALKDPLASGFFFNLSRQIARKGALQNTIDPPPSESSGFAGFVTFFARLRDNASFRFFVTMTNLGDNSIGQFFKGRNYIATKGEPLLTRTKTNWGAYNVSPASVGATPSLFIIPQSYQKYRAAMKKGGNVASGWSVASEGGIDQFVMNEKEGPRIKDSLADEIEAKLEAEYMPFYIKDLRTNEIISFHAFLTSFSDGFSSTYGETRGLGRIEPALTYESTSRTISVAFAMIAFSPEDMDMLYWKLNKLVTLCYPQFSKGTELSTQNADGQPTTFYMPFSQIPTASPMVRLRIGDIITSNYSSTAAARMLGVGQFEKDGIIHEEAEAGGGVGLGNIRLGGDPKPKSPRLSAKTKQEWAASMVPEETVKKIIGPMLLSTSNFDEGLVVGDIIKIGVSGPTSRATSGAASGVSRGSVSPLGSGRITIASVPGFLAATVKKNGGMNVPGQIKPAIEDTFEIIGFETGKKYPEGHRLAGKIIPNDIKIWVTPKTVTELATGAAEEGVDKKVLKTIKYLKEAMTSKLCFSINIRQIFEVNPSTRAISQASKDFIANNTISKAFQNNRGSGLAGFIDNLQLDWQLNTIQWGTESGRRAPQGCIVTMGFKPVHDITPGLDADGLNRAPVYKVGNIVGQLDEPDAVTLAVQQRIKKMSE